MPNFYFGFILKKTKGASMSVDLKYKWDTSQYCKDQAEFESRLEYIKQTYPKVESFKGKLNDKPKLLEYLKLSDELSDVIEKIANWVQCGLSIDVTDSTQQNNMQRLEILDSKIGQSQAFVMPEILGLPDEFFDDIIADPQFLPWKHTFKVLKTQKLHTLNAEQEKIVATLAPVGNSFSKIFESCMYSDVNLGEIFDSKGNTHKLTKTNYSNILQSPDRVLRKNALERYFSTYGNYLNTMAQNLIAQVQRNIILADLYKYDSVLVKSFSGDNISKEFYNNFIKNAMPLFKLNKEFNNIKAKAIKKQYNIEKLEEYDLGLPLGKKCKDISYEQGFEITKNAVSVLGEDYIQILNQALTQRWVDVYPDKHKNTGGFCTSAHNCHPLVLVNWENSLSDVYTISHELGHAVRAVYCDKHNYREGLQAPMFIEETFSTINQTLMYRYLIDNETDIDTKIYYLYEYLSTTFSYVVGSVQDSLCEDNIYSCVSKGLPIDTKSILKYADEVYAKTRNDEVKTAHAPIRSLTMIHYYSVPYYVWQYSCGVINANFIVNRIQKDKNFVQKFKQFASAGSMYPLDMLKLVDIDYSTDAPFKEIEEELTYRLNQLKELLNQK